METARKNRSFTKQKKKREEKRNVTSFAVEGRGGRERVRTEVTEALRPALKRGGEATVGGEDPVAAEPPVDHNTEPVPEPELQRPGLVLP